ncbi:MAG: hypothetical protein QM493_05540 [Sulfurovum sp.]
MNLEQITEFFKYMSIINIIILMINSILIMVLKDFIYKIHAKLFGINEANLAVVIYGYLGMFKIMVIIFNIVPYVALVMMQ